MCNADYCPPSGSESIFPPSPDNEIAARSVHDQCYRTRIFAKHFETVIITSFLERRLLALSSEAAVSCSQLGMSCKSRLPNADYTDVHC